MRITKKSLMELKEVEYGRITCSDRNLKNWVIDDILQEKYIRKTSIKEYIEEVLNRGCVSGAVSSLVSYRQTDVFFDKFSDEIFELLDKHREDVGGINFEISKNSLSWFAYEVIVYNLMCELDTEY